ncbi:hypothetical protein L0B70_04645 [Kaistella sp. 97-N-M2]|uniref:hypothetical protein n=1 Tax=Kaistella sp. 97-N-M2 TaxID=2908645 RepID=UPI001F16AF93|nr:hypothetical protein [Kaistella sp. 97-N-M2]UJF30681.1 hypothetical protein L0B70_04645 [Kaistella sp. 97-N-M2]
MFTVLFCEKAMEDLEIAVGFYNNISVELGKKFIQNFDETSLQLETNPFFQIRYDEMRIRRSRNSRFYCISLLLQKKP